MSSNIVERAAEWMNQMKQRGRPVLCLRLDCLVRTESLRPEFKKQNELVSNRWSLNSLLVIHCSTTVLLRLHFSILRAKLGQ